MSIDRTAKVLLGLILLALCVLIFRQEPKAALGAPLSSEPAPATTMIYNYDANTGGRLFVVSNGLLSLWYVSPDDQNVPKLHLADAKPLPATAK